MSVRPTTVSTAIVGEWDNPYGSSANAGMYAIRQSMNQSLHPGLNNSNNNSNNASLKRQIDSTSVNNSKNTATSTATTPNLNPFAGPSIDISSLSVNSLRDSISTVLLTSRDRDNRDREVLLSSRDRRDTNIMNNLNLNHSVNSNNTNLNLNIAAYNQINTTGDFAPSTTINSYALFDELNTARSSISIRSGAPPMNHFMYSQINEDNDDDNPEMTHELGRSMSSETIPSKLHNDDSTTSLLTGRSNDNNGKAQYTERLNSGRTSSTYMPPIAIKMSSARGNTTSVSNPILSSRRSKRRDRTTALHLNIESDTVLSDNELDEDNYDLSVGIQSTGPHRNTVKKSTEMYYNQPSSVPASKFRISPTAVAVPMV
jgi:hypothetical protein